MANLIHKLRQLIKLGKGDAKRSADLPALPEVLNDDVIKQLMQMVDNTHQTEYSCEDTFNLLDEYVELASNHEDIAALMPLVKHHLDMCVDCREQFETLLRVIETESSAPAA